MANILFGKLGQQIVYDRNLPEAIRSNTNGNYESYNLLRMLSSILRNVFVVEDNILISLEQQKANGSIKLITDFVPKIDYAFVLLGVSEQFISKKLLNIINSGIKWYALCSDPRCLNALTKYIINPPICVFAGAAGLECEIGGKKFITKYLNIEAANVYQESLPRDLEYKHDCMVVIANQTPTWDRIKNIKEMTARIPKAKVVIYGRNSGEDLDERFRGERSLQFIYNSQLLSKVTYIAPISPGWITAKYIECIYRGVIPLVSPEYATLVPGFREDIINVDRDLLVETPDDVLNMYTKIVFYKKYYNETINKLNEMVREKYGPRVLERNLIKLMQEE